MHYSDSSLTDSRILVVDDNDQNIRLVSRMLEWTGFKNFRTVTDSRLAIAAMIEYRPDLVLLDLHMPFVDGFEILVQLGALSEDFGFMPVLVFTADGAEAAKTQAFSLGASDFITKPVNQTEIIQRVRNFLRTRKMHVALQSQNETLERKVRERTSDLEDARMEILENLATAGEFRDDDTGEHTKRVGQIAGEIATALGLAPKECELIRLAAQLHDIGKIGIPDSVLLKPGKLTPEEFAVMRQHTEIGASILKHSKAPLLKIAREIALYHHEHWDGSGYPTGLAGEDIPICARIVAVADVFDALTHERAYKRAWEDEQAFAEIRNLSGTNFDPCIVEAFFRSRPMAQIPSVAA